MTKTLLIIGGLDPSGGAGVVADIEAAQAFNVVPCCIVSALTVQNNHAYLGHEAVSPSLIQTQLHCLFEESAPDAIKLGMLPSYEQAVVLSETLHRANWKGPFVWDTVLTSSSGGALFPLSEFEKIVAVLKPYLSGITPNLNEARVLAEVNADSDAIVKALYQKLDVAFPFFILLKGGHADGEEAVDLLYDGRDLHRFTSPRIRHLAHSRGTGCRLATALAAALASGTLLPESAFRAKQWVWEYLQGNVSIFPRRGDPCDRPA